MATLYVERETASLDPIDVIEQIVAANEWPFDRAGDGELSVAVNGSWCDYHFGFSWREPERALQLTLAFDMRVPPARRTEIYALLGLINEQLWLGHFDLWSEDGAILFRHASLIGENVSVGVCEELIDIAVSTCERFYPAFQFVLWGGKSAQEALAASLIDTVGEA
ncbi:YbjN domain-containing protein [Zavarzinia sp.]|uniref:YbjN domain-containing protein n=1 Tax=Zavarzinia sp. TaxID=2027920 RepID=UPI003568CCC4